MNPKLSLACLSVLLLAACTKPAEPVAPAEPAGPASAAAPHPAPAAESAPAASTADVPFDTKGFAGTFSGTLPCADCPGIDTRIALASDGSFKLDETYRDRKDGTSQLDGTWTVEADNKRIRLDPNSKAAEDRLFEIVSNDEILNLGEDGKRTEGTPASLRRDDSAAK